MARRKKTTILLTALALLLILFVLALEVLAPRLINSESIKRSIEAGVSERLGGKVELGAVDISMLPRPHVMIEKARLDLPGSAAGTMEALNIYPKILPLLRGKVRIARVNVTGPELRVNLPKSFIPAFTVSVLKKKLAPVMSVMERAAPGLVVKIDGGSFDIARDGRYLLTIRDMDARVGLPPTGLSFSMTGSSGFWDSISVEGVFGSGDLSGRIRTRVKGLRPGPVVRGLFPGLPVGVGSSELDLSFNAEIGEEDELTGELRGDITRLLLIRDKKKTVITGGDLAGMVYLEDRRVKLSLTGLRLENPQFNLTGEFTRSRDTGGMTLKLAGSDADIPSSRAVALSLAGEIPAVKELFAVVKGGRLPVINFETSGKTARELALLDNLSTAFTMRDGEITVPKIGLDIRGVKGEMEIREGILTGKNLSGIHGKTMGAGASLRVGIRGGEAPLGLGVNLSADLAELPALLTRLVRNDTFQKELSLIDEISGRARGRLTLSGTTRSVRARTEFPEFSLKAMYRRVPYPIEIRRGGFKYEKERVEVSGLEGSVGATAFAGVNAAFGIGKTPFMEITSARARVSAGELHRTLTLAGVMEEVNRRVESVDGMVGLDSIEIKGPILKPRSWIFRFVGKTDGIYIKTPLAPGAVAAHGGFEATEKKLTLREIGAATEKTSVVLSGTAEDYLRGFVSSGFRIDGTVGPTVVVWLHERFRLPGEVRVRAPFTLEGGLLEWKRGERASFRGEIKVEKGPALSVDVLRDTGGFEIKGFRIKDDESDASIRMSLRGGSFSAGFSGELKGSSLTGLLEDNRFLKGWVRGEMELAFPVEKPWSFDARGDVTGAGVPAPPGLGLPVEIRRFSLKAEGGQVRIRSAEAGWTGLPFSVEGELGADADGLSVDLDAFTESFDWGNVEELLEERKKAKEEKPAEGPPARKPLPLYGNLRFDTRLFTFKGREWRPFHTDITLSPDLKVITITEAGICGISTPGTVKIADEGMDFLFTPFARGSALEETLECLAGKEGLTTGVYDLSARLSSKGPTDRLLHNLSGELEFTAQKGRIYRFGLLAKIFALLNLTELFRGELPDLTTAGFAYKSMVARGKFEGGSLVLTEALMNSSAMEIAGEGAVDLVDRELDLKLLVAPFKTVDFIIKRLPLLGEILGGALVTIPVRVSGDIKDPRVEYMKPADIGSRVQGIMERTLKLPLKIIEPVILGNGKKEKK